MTSIFFNSDFGPADLLEVISISRGSLIAADLIVIIVTLVTTYKSAIMARSVLNGRRNKSFAFLLFRDGIMYFL